MTLCQAVKARLKYSISVWSVNVVIWSVRNRYAALTLRFSDYYPLSRSALYVYRTDTSSNQCRQINSRAKLKPSISTLRNDGYFDRLIALISLYLLLLKEELIILILHIYLLTYLFIFRDQGTLFPRAVNIKKRNIIYLFIVLRMQSIVVSAYCIGSCSCIQFLFFSFLSLWIFVV